MYTIEESDGILLEIRDYCENAEFEVKINEKKCKINIRNDNFTMDVRIERVDENVCCIKLEKVLGEKFDFLNSFNEIKTYLAESNLIL